MSCPDYYLLANGREFIDFANNELSAWLKPRVSHEAYHCIISAMEHRFRRGNKEGEAETDLAAEAFWLCQAQELLENDCISDYCLPDVLPVIVKMVDAEREFKVHRLKVNKMFEDIRKSKHND
jgi:hypothetical protein